MNCYEALEIDEVTPVQYVGVYVMRWQPEWGEPTVAFRESKAAVDLLEACKIAIEWVGVFFDPSDPYANPQRVDDWHKIESAIARVEGEE